MRIKITADISEESKDILNELTALTDHALLNIKDVRYDKNTAEIFLPVIRLRVIKKKLLGLITVNKYDKSIKKRSLVIIKNVIDCNIVNNFDEPHVENITILFGL